MNAVPSQILEGKWAARSMPPSFGYSMKGATDIDRNGYPGALLGTHKRSLGFPGLIARVVVTALLMEVMSHFGDIVQVLFVPAVLKAQLLSLKPRAVYLLGVSSVTHALYVSFRLLSSSL